MTRVCYARTEEVCVDAKQGRHGTLEMKIFFVMAHSILNIETTKCNRYECVNGKFIAKFA